MVTVKQEVRLLNFVIVGEIRSGTTVVQTTVNSRRGAVCHGDLFHPVDEVRRAAHEAYFGLCKDPQKLQEWFVDGVTNPFQYINRAILDNPQNGECAIGCRLLYQEVLRWELWELFEARCREGDFCLVHVVRNPVACLVSLKQAERSGVWTRSWGSPVQTGCPSAVTLDPAELIEFCRRHVAVQSKIRASCTDHLQVDYRELFMDYQVVMRKVFEFLELPDSDDLAVPGVRRLRNRGIRDRIYNLADLRRVVPSDIRQLLDGEDMF